MKISLQWMKELGGKGLDGPPADLAAKIGAQLGEVEGIIDLESRYQGIVVAKVIDCSPHPNADRLKICQIYDAGKIENVSRNKSGYVQVVCGAPNVRVGMLVAWIPPGVTVPSTAVGDAPFKLETRDIRGEKSSGMLASPKELGISENHDGILEVDQPAKPGQSFAAVYKLDDHIIEIENKMFTHRPDCFGQLGVAREISGIHGLSFRSPDWYLKPGLKFNPKDNSLPLKVHNEILELSPRFMAISIKDVEIKPSPIWLQTYLSRVGVRPINNIVDITNYMMLLSAQPLHAYDYDKVLALDPGAKHASLVVRRPRPNEKITLIGDKQVSLNGEEIVIATASEAIGLGGVMGGASTQVDNDTKNIILECASFDMYTTRRTSMAHGLFTDAVTRFTKGQSPYQTEPVIIKTAQMIADLGGPEVSYASPIIDIKKQLTPLKKVEVSADFINARLGLELSPEAMKKLLQNVEIEVELSGNVLSVQSPFWRTDIEIPEDVVEEIGRLYGYDHLPVELPKRPIIPPAKNVMFEIKSQLRNSLAGAGANEVLTYSFVHGDLLEKSAQSKSMALELNNALSPDLQYYRLSLTPSLLEKVYPNLRSDYVRSEDNEFALFELNVSHNKSDKDPDGLPKEWQSLALVFAADDKTADRKYLGAPFYGALRYLRLIIGHNSPVLNIVIVPLHTVKPSDLESSKWAEQMVKPFDRERSAAVIDETGNIRGIVGEYRTEVIQAFKLPNFSSGFELDITVFEASARDSGYKAIPLYPKVVQDITLKVESKVTFNEVFDFIWEQLSQDKPNDTLFNLEPVGIYQSDKDRSHRQITLRLWISATDRTLKAEAVNELLDQVASKAKKKLGAQRI